MGLFARLFGLGPRDATGLNGKDANTTSKQASQAPVSIRASSATTNGVPATNYGLQIVADPCEAQDDDEGSIFAPTPVSIASSCCSSLSRRRTAIDISPAAVQRFANKVAILESSHLRSSFSGSGGVTHAELKALYADMQLIHRGRAREIHTGRRVVIKAYPAAQMTPPKRSNLDRHIRALKGAMALLGPQGGVVGLERVLENSEGLFLVLQACNGGTLIEAIANAGGKLPEWQVAVKVALPVLTVIAELHANGILHRDIKPEHLLIHNGNLKLGDFGSAACATAAAACAAAVSFPGCSDQATVQDRQQQQQQQGLQHNQQQAEHTLQQQQKDVPRTPEQQLHQQFLSGQPMAFLSQDGSSIPASKISSHHHVNFAVSMTAAPAVHRYYSSTGGCEPTDPTNFRIGSIEYMAPEMLSKPTAAEVFHMVISKGIDEDDLPAYDATVDIWSLGVVLYEALTGVQPFLADSAADMAVAIAHKLNGVSHGRQTAPQQQQQPNSFSGHQQYDMQSGCVIGLPSFIQQLPISTQGKLFVAACLNPDPARRPSAQQLLQHAWIAETQAEAAAAAARRRSIGGQNNTSSKAQHVGVAAAAPAAELQLHRQALHSTSTLQGMCFRAPPGAAIDAHAGTTTAGLPGTSTGSQEPLLDQHLVQLASCEHPACIDICSADHGASFHTTALLRAQTSTNLELGVQSVLRTRTLRLSSKPSLQHV